MAKFELSTLVNKWIGSDGQSSTASLRARLGKNAILTKTGCVAIGEESGCSYTAVCWWRVPGCASAVNEEAVGRHTGRIEL